MNVRPLHDRIIVRRLEEGEQRIGGLGHLAPRVIHLSRTTSGLTPKLQAYAGTGHRD